jgi:hypothetical protein
VSISSEQLAANRANAQHSTGPASEEGKAASSRNALKHGLTGNTVLLPVEDKTEFQRFCAEIIACLEPETPVEREFAQIVANSQWRLKRIKSIEDGLLADGQFGPADPFTEPASAGDSEVLARSFMDHRRSFNNLSQYEHRLYRTMVNALKQLKDLQAARNKYDKDVASEANRLYLSWRYNSDSPFGQPKPEPVAETAIAVPARDGFVFPTVKTSPETPENTPVQSPPPGENGPRTPEREAA